MKLRNSVLALASIFMVTALGCGSSGKGGNDGSAKGGSGGGAGAGSGGATGVGGTTGAGGTTGSGGTTGAGGGGSGGRGGSGGAASGGSGGGATDAGGNQDARTTDARDAGSTGGDGSAATMSLTSTGFTDGVAMIPAVYTCAGADTSPDLSWTAGPAQTMSYAIVLTDMSNGFVHWVLWDIPTSTMSLPANLPGAAMLTSPAGAKQVHLSGTGNGYVGPCPGANTHTYQFRIHAIDVATLPTITTSSASTAARDQVVMHSIAHGDLSGMARTQ